MKDDVGHPIEFDDDLNFFQTVFPAKLLGLHGCFKIMRFIQIGRPIGRVLPKRSIILALNHNFHQALGKTEL